MPIYEYECRGCQNRFELLVFASTSPACPACQATDLERLMSPSSFSSDGTRQRNLGRAREGAQETQYDKARAEHEAIHHHDH
jgi:putative FmdB family regulatory protein